MSLKMLSRQKKLSIFFISIIVIVVTMISRNVTDLQPGAYEQGLRNETIVEKPLDPCSELVQSHPKHPPSNESSFFNCDSPDGQCRYFYPARFFDPKCGPGKDFNSLITKTKDLYNDGTLWLGMPYIPLPQIQITNVTNQVTKRPFQSKNITFIHVHKTGGTSLVSAFSGSLRQYKFKGTRNIIYNPSHAQAENEMMKANGTNISKNKLSPVRQYIKQKQTTSNVLDGAVTYPDQWGSNDVMITAVVRDPIDRFVSAVGQAMGGTGSRGRTKPFVRDCTRKTIQDTLKCVIDYILANGTFFELHFTPMALELSFASMYKDVPIALFPFESVPQYLTELGIAPKKLKEGSKSRTPYLRGMNSSYLDEDMIQSVCNIFNVDVIMMRSLGWEVPRCDEYIPKL